MRATIGRASRARRPSLPDGPRRRRARQARWRRTGAALLAGAAVLALTGALAPGAVGGAVVPTVVAVRDLPVGAVVGADDLAVVDRPASHRPATAHTDPAKVVGRTTAGPLSARDVITDDRLVGDTLLRGQPAGRLSMSVPVLDVDGTGAAPGSRVDLYATGSGEVSASDVLVLAVHVADDGSGLGVTAPARLTVALDAAQAAEVARGLGALEGGQIFTVAVHHAPDPPQ